MSLGQGDSGDDPPEEDAGCVLATDDRRAVLSGIRNKGAPNTVGLRGSTNRLVSALVQLIVDEVDGAVNPVGRPGPDNFRAGCCPVENASELESPPNNGPLVVTREDRLLEKIGRVGCLVRLGSLLFLDCVAWGAWGGRSISRNNEANAEEGVGASLPTRLRQCLLSSSEKLIEGPEIEDRGLTLG